jgi:hypothetical protein
MTALDGSSALIVVLSEGSYNDIEISLRNLDGVDFKRFKWEEFNPTGSSTTDLLVMVKPFFTVDDIRTFERLNALNKIAIVTNVYGTQDEKLEATGHSVIYRTADRFRTAGFDKQLTKLIS